MTHTFMEPDAASREAALEQADVISRADMFEIAAAEAVLDLVQSWATSIGYGFDGTPKELLSDIEETRAAVNAALDRLKDFVEENPVSPLDLLAKIPAE